MRRWEVTQQHPARLPLRNKAPSLIPLVQRRVFKIRTKEPPCWVGPLDFVSATAPCSALPFQGRSISGYSFSPLVIATSLVRSLESRTFRKLSKNSLLSFEKALREFRRRYFKASIRRRGACARVLETKLIFAQQVVVCFTHCCGLIVSACTLSCAMSF